MLKNWTPQQKTVSTRKRAATFQASQVNGWWPHLSPDGKMIAYGANQLWVADLTTGKEHLYKDSCQAIGWIGPRRLAAVVYTSNSTAELYYLDITEVGAGTPVKQPNDPAQVAGSYIHAADGHMISTLDAGRVIYDGKIIANVRWGGHCAGDYAVVRGEIAPGVWGYELYLKGQLIQAMPFMGGAPEVRVTRDGVVSYGYNGPSWLVRNGRQENITITPWGAESIACLVDVEGTKWAWTSTVGQQRGPMVLGRIAGEDEAITLPDFPAVRPEVVYNKELETFIIAGNSDKGWLQVRTVHRLEAKSAVDPEMSAFPAKLGFGAFFQFSDRYGDMPEYPSNFTIVAEPGAVARAASRVPMFITKECVLEGVRYQDKVLGLYIGDTGSATNAERQAQEIKELWRFSGGKPKPVLWYVTKKEPTLSDWRIPTNVDYVGPEFYFDEFDADIERLRELLWRMLGFWTSALGRSRPWIPICQAYNRNGQVADMTSIIQIQPAFMQQLINLDRRIGQLPPAIGLAFFAVTRPGGIRDYPKLLSWHRAMFASIPGPMVIKPLEEEDVVNAPEVTVRKWDLDELKNGEEMIVEDTKNPHLGYRFRVFIKDGSMHAEIVNRTASAQTGARRPVKVIAPLKPPVSYSEFIDEASKISEAYGGKPTPGDLFHNAWRRLVEFWPFDQLIQDIKK